MSQLHREYFNNIAREWNEMVPADPGLAKYMVEFGVQADDYVLDVGAGTGRLSSVLSKLIGINGLVIAMDIANEMLEQIDESIRNVACLCADICHPPLVKNYFDKIICFSSFPHIKNKHLALLQSYSLLNSGGKLLIFHTKCSRKLNTFHHQLNKIVCDDKLPRAADLAKMAESVGFNSDKSIEQPDIYWVELSKPL